MDKEEIKAIRLSTGLTQEKFAYQIGANHSSINKWENGKTKPSRLYIKELEKFKEKTINIANK